MVLYYYGKHGKLQKERFGIFYFNFLFLNHNKGENYTFLHFKNLFKDKKLQKATIYCILKCYDDQGHIDHKPCSCRPKKMSSSDLKKINIECNSKTGVTQSMLENKFSVYPWTVEKT